MVSYSHVSRQIIIFLIFDDKSKMLKMPPDETNGKRACGILVEVGF